jgi:hypothetical protein
MSTIQAAVGQKFLSKSDRLFSNRLSDIFIETLQNARRAGASSVDVTTSEAGQGTRIIFTDNGEGIDDFSVLLQLGDSNWDQMTSDKEDPAGMGFYALLHSGVTVRSRGQQAVINKAGFLGLEPVEVVEADGPENGTVLLFDRPEKIGVVEDALLRAAQFGSLEVRLNGKVAPREDFLHGALLVKEVLGVRIGVYSNYARSAWNFHGRVIVADHNLPHLSRVTVDLKGERGDLYARVDVLEARHIHLKLPDRTAIVEDEKHVALWREVKIALYEYLATLPRHTAPYSSFVEAHKLGVQLKEATPWFKTFYERPSWEGTDGDLFSEQTSLIANGGGHVIFDREESDSDWLAFTFLIALEHFQELPIVTIDDVPEYEGYSWYGPVPRIRGLRLTIDGKPIKETDSSYPSLAIADSIQLSFVLDREGSEEAILWDLPFAGFRDGDWSEEFSLVITRSSPWARPDPASLPFDLLDAAVYIAFSPSDDCDADSSDTQLDDFRRNTHLEVISVLGGKLAQTRHALNEALFGWRNDVSGYLREANVSEIRVTKNQTGGWDTELITSLSTAA